MRVLFDHSTPFSLAHGGLQIQIEQTATALRAVGVAVEFMRWWDDRQDGDIIHYFGRPTEAYMGLARQKGRKTVIADLNTELGSRRRLTRLAQKALTEAARSILPGSFTARLGWRSFASADAIIALTSWEAHLFDEMFRAPRERIHVIPNGVEEVFFQAKACARGPWLVCTATITERKRVLEVACAAAKARTPVWIIGKPYSSGDPYAKSLESLAREEPQWVRYEGPVQDRTRLAAIYREARGFVLLSAMESLSLSALEAAACECPLLLSDLPWARSVFGEHASYCPIDSTARTASALRGFYDNPPAPRFKPLTWREVALQLLEVYERLLRTT